MEWDSSVDIAATPAVVWQVLGEVEAWPEWTPATRTSAPRVLVGALTSRLTRRYLELETSGLKRHCER